MTSELSDSNNWKIQAKKSLEGREILRQVGRASKDFGLIEPDDRILVACSGGKDSYTLLWSLTEIQRRVPFKFELIAINIDMGFGGFHQEPVGEFLNTMAVAVELVAEKAGDICRAKLGPEGNACWLCARLRRGVLYTQARRLGCNKLALGHHADDIVETLMINMFFAGQLKAMPPRLRIDEGDLLVIRPLAYVYEDSIRHLAKRSGFPIVDCNCSYGCTLSMGQRAETKRLLTDLSERIPDLKSHLLAALTNVRPSHLLDRKLYSFDD